MISGSITDTQPVFDAIVQSCQRLFDGKGVALVLPRGAMIETVAFARSGAEAAVSSSPGRSIAAAAPAPASSTRR